VRLSCQGNPDNGDEWLSNVRIAVASASALMMLHCLFACSAR
jgi:hypothetical protein